MIEHTYRCSETLDYTILTILTTLTAASRSIKIEVRLIPHHFVYNFLRALPAGSKCCQAFTRLLHEEINANEILLHISFQSGPVVSCTGVKFLLQLPCPFHSAAQAQSLAKIWDGININVAISVTTARFPKKSLIIL
jgi:hypothetical protein